MEAFAAVVIIIVLVVLVWRVNDKQNTVETTEPPAPEIDTANWDEFPLRAQRYYDSLSGKPGWAWAEEQVAIMRGAVPNIQKTGDGGVDARYFGTLGDKQVVIPIQVKMTKSSVGRPALDRLLGVQTSMANQGDYAPMSIMVTLYPSSKKLREYARAQGTVTVMDGETEQRYPRMQLMSVQEMLTAGEEPALPPAANGMLKRPFVARQTKQETEGEA